MVVSDPAELDVPALSDLAISLFLPKTTEATTLHILAMQTSYVSSDTGDSTADVKFPVAKTIRSWPFLTGVDVAASAHGAAIVAFGSSLTDGDGSTLDTNRRWPDVLAERLQKGADGMTEVGVLNQGIIGNRLLNDSPRRARSPFGAALGQAGLARFKRDVLAQAGVGYVIVGLGINDIVFPGSLTPLTERMNAESMISGYRQLIRRAHQKGIRVIGTTNHRSRTRSWSYQKLRPRSPFIVRRKRSCAKRSTTGYAAAVNSMMSSISTWFCRTRATQRDCSLFTTAETICIPTMQVTSLRGMRFPLRCGRPLNQRQAG